MRLSKSQSKMEYVVTNLGVFEGVTWEDGSFAVPPCKRGG